MDVFAALNRRSLLQRSAFGLGSIALSQLLAQEEAARSGTASPLISTTPLPNGTHFQPRARNVIFIFMSGGPSHLDLFDPKPQLTRFHGQPVPDSNLSLERNSSSPQPAQRYRPARCSFQYGPVNAISVPSCRSTR